MRISTSIAAAALTAGAALAFPATAYADSPVPGEQCHPSDAREGAVELEDGTVLECSQEGRGPKGWEWVDVTPDDEGDDESEEDEDGDDEGKGEEQDGKDEDDGTGDEQGKDKDHDKEGGKGEGDDGGGLTCVDLNEADAETLQMLMHVGPDRAQQIIDLRPIAELQQLDEVDGLAWGGVRLEELIAGDGEEWLPVCELDAVDDGKGDEQKTPGDGGDQAAAAGGEGKGGLPVTGGALAGLVAAAVATLGGGGAAMYFSRKRRAAQG